LGRDVVGPEFGEMLIRGYFGWNVKERRSYCITSLEDLGILSIFWSFGFINLCFLKGFGRLENTGY
jgi:hypothetical protein